jgi:hypothetical protein
MAERTNPTPIDTSKNAISYFIQQAVTGEKRNFPATQGGAQLMPYSHHQLVSSYGF